MTAALSAALVVLILLNTALVITWGRLILQARALLESWAVIVTDARARGLGDASDGKDGHPHH